MRRNRWRLADLISGSTATALRALVSQAQAAFARWRRPLLAGILVSPGDIIYPLPLYKSSTLIGRHPTIRGAQTAVRTIRVDPPIEALRGRWRGHRLKSVLLCGA